MTANDLPLLIEQLKSGERRAIARSLRIVDDDPALGRRLAMLLRFRGKNAWVVGVTGNPGAGKSTLVSALVSAARNQDKKVAVLAIDPSSPFSGGAILGDRIRMHQHTMDDGVYIRSLATRGALGGLSRATAESVRVLDVAGFDLILIETVGVGQDEVDIVRLADSTLVVMTPGLGDDVQAIKAGILEIADIFVINKADRDGVFELERALQQNLDLAPPRWGWRVPILRTIASLGTGIDELMNSMTEHRIFMHSEAGRVQVQKRACDLFERLLDAALVEHGRQSLSSWMDEARERLLHHSSDPYEEVAHLLTHMTTQGNA